MNRYKQNADFLHIGERLVKWYTHFGRDLPFRTTKDPYIIWISEIIFQQTRISQGMAHFERFIARFPDVFTLADAPKEEVLLYWKGLGYYSRALNIHKAAQQIVTDFHGNFPSKYEDILALKGVGKYTASAISSISFGEERVAVDGNFYRVLSRIFADSFDISSSKGFDYFSGLAHRILPEGRAGDFNQAMMDLGSEICKPRNPLCEQCPLSEDCLAFQTNSVTNYPVKKSKTKVLEENISYYFIHHGPSFLIQQRDQSGIWKNLYEFPNEIDEQDSLQTYHQYTVSHKLSHRKLTITIASVELQSTKELETYAHHKNLVISDLEDFHNKSFPKPLQNFIENQFVRRF